MVCPIETLMAPSSTSCTFWCMYGAPDIVNPVSNSRYVVYSSARALKVCARDLLVQLIICLDLSGKYFIFKLISFIIQ